MPEAGWARQVRAHPRPAFCPPSRRSKSKCQVHRTTHRPRAANQRAAAEAAEASPCGRCASHTPRPDPTPAPCPPLPASRPGPVGPTEGGAGNGGWWCARCGQRPRP
eukprot:6600793-Alexandrium_andersonii.AAC.1